MSELSVIIVSYNTEELLRECLRSIKKADKPKGGLQVIVVDNASRDNSRQMVKKEFEDVQLIKSKKNLGFAAANNRGVKDADGKYLLFLNSDTKIYRDSLVKPLKYLKTHPEVGALTVKLVLGNGKLDPDNHRGIPTPWVSITHFLGLSKLFPKSKLFNGYYQSYKNMDSIHSIDITAGSYMMMRKKLFDDLGGWDEKFFFYGEDIDLSYRIREIGKKIIYYPKSTVIHYKGASSGIRKESRKITTATLETKIRISKESTKAMRLFYQKHFTHLYPKLVTSMVLAGIGLLGQWRVYKLKMLRWL